MNQHSQFETEQQEHIRLMGQALHAIDVARLCGVSSLKISEALIWLELRRPMAVMTVLKIKDL